MMNSAAFQPYSNEAQLLTPMRRIGVMSSPQLGLFALDEPLSRVPERIGVATIGIREKAKALNDTSDYLDSDYSLNPYVGCGFGCSYCYAAFFVPDEDRKKEWGKWIDVKINSVREILRKRDLRGKKIFMSSATDPYQPLERRVQLTRGIVEALCDPARQPDLTVMTRSPIVTRDIDLFKQFEKIQVNMSITTDSDAIRKRFEPSCASIEQRIEAISEVKAAGIRIGIGLSPLLPLEDPEKFAKRIAAIEPDVYWASTFNISHGHFTGSTRSPALTLAREYDWNAIRCKEAIRVMSKYLPKLARFA